MTNEGEVSKPIPKEIERLASERAGEKIKSAKWDSAVALCAYATLAAVLILNAGNVALEVVAIVAITGLALVWLIGWIRGKRLFRRFYDDELKQLEAFSSARKVEATIPSVLTPRETEILTYIARGYMNKQVAHKLGVSEHTIKNHLSSILHKLEVNDRTQAVVLAIQNNWISPPEIEPPESTTSDEI